jgi:hypothetical protein
MFQVLSELLEKIEWFWRYKEFSGHQYGRICPYHLHVPLLQHNEETRNVSREFTKGIAAVGTAGRGVTCALPTSPPDA